MNETIKILIIFTLTITFIGCNTTKSDNEVVKEKEEAVKPLVDNVLSAKDQAALTPDKVIQYFKEGNKRFINNDLTSRDHSSQVRKSTFGQFPKAIILSCVDSRVPVEDVFDRGIGDLFVARVAGNFVNVDILGSMEFACKVSGSKIILVLGHEHCGAVKAAIDKVELGNITEMLTKINPAIELVTGHKDERTSKNTKFVHDVCESNVKNTINEIRLKSPILKEMEDNGEIKIVGAIYDMNNGEVVFL